MLSYARNAIMSFTYREVQQKSCGMSLCARRENQEIAGGSLPGLRGKAWRNDFDSL